MPVTKADFGFKEPEPVERSIVDTPAERAILETVPTPKPNPPERVPTSRAQSARSGRTDRSKGK